jgi:hypothetical protein
MGKYRLRKREACRRDPSMVQQLNAALVSVIVRLYYSSRSGGATDRRKASPRSRWAWLYWCATCQASGKSDHGADAYHHVAHSFPEACERLFPGRAIAVSDQGNWRSE